MDKKKYDVSIADVEMAILSDEREDFVMRLVGDLDQKIRQITLANKRCSKLDAAILVALDASGEKLKADKRVRNLEAQIGLYDANLRRLREENTKLKEAMLQNKAAVQPDPGEKAEEEADAQQLEMIQLDSAEEEKAEETATKETKEDAPAATSRGDKLRQIESLLRGKSNG